MTSNRLLIGVWLTLLGLTLLSVLIAESGNVGSLATIFVCFIVSLKGQLVIDRFIGLRDANQTIRKIMLAYFYIIPILIVWGAVFPDVIVAITTLG